MWDAVTATNINPQVEFAWNIGEVPFYIGAQATPTNRPLPDMLPLRVGVDGTTGALVQIVDSAVQAALADAYVLGSQIGTPLSIVGAGQPALEDFLAFVLEIHGERLAGASVLEIGCGSGALLSRIARDGAYAVGVEPDVQSAEYARAAGLEVIAQTFDPDLFPDNRFDLIIHHAVLEHVDAPATFLAEQLGLLKEGGMIICSVPDCTLPLAHGDLSMLVHEHVSYFTPASLDRLAIHAGAQTVAIRSSRAAGSTYCALRRAPVASSTAPRMEETSAEGFVSAARRCLELMQTHLEEVTADRRTLGIFCPSRFVNYHALLDAVVPEVRYFDDDPLLEGRYFPPFDVAIESRTDLIRRPVSEVLVMSWTFGEVIASSLRTQRGLAGTRVVTIGDLIAPQHVD